MEINRDRLLYATERAQWRSWLRKHYRSEKEVWLVFHKKHTGKPRIEYNAAVEEALCFGWIDSTAKRLDEDSYAQRFSPRRPGSRYSQANLERLRALARKGKVARDVLATLGGLLDPNPAAARPATAPGDPPLPSAPADDGFAFPPDILEAVRASPEAWKNFQGFSPSYQRIRIAYIEGARKRPEEFQKRLRHFIRMTEKNRQFGYGGIQKYY